MNPCRSLCAWVVTDRKLDGLDLFRCEGCRSEWTAAEGWTPIDGDGRVPPAVRAERAAHASRTSVVPPDGSPAV